MFRNLGGMVILHLLLTPQWSCQNVGGIFICCQYDIWEVKTEIRL